MFRKNKHWSVYSAGIIACLPFIAAAFWLFFRVLEFFGAHHVIFGVTMFIVWLVAAAWWCLGSIVVMGGADQ